MKHYLAAAYHSIQQYMACSRCILAQDKKLPRCSTWLAYNNVWLWEGKYKPRLKHYLAAVQDKCTTYGLQQRKISTQLKITLLQFMINIQRIACSRDISVHDKRLPSCSTWLAYNNVWLSEGKYKHTIKGYLVAVHGKHTTMYDYQQGNTGTW